MPTVSEDYQDGDVPAIDGMRLVANSEQSFGKWARRVRELFSRAVLFSRMSAAHHDGKGYRRRTH